MGPTRVWLIRHGRIAEEWRGRIYGDHDVPLAPEGEADLERVADLLDGEPLAAVAATGLTRTDAGARRLAGPRGLIVRTLPGLREVGRGAWVGLSLAELEQRDPGAFAAWLQRPASTRPAGGESLADVGRRAWPELAHLAREHAGLSVAVVSHCWAIRALLCQVVGMDLDLAPRLDVAPGSVHLVEWPAAASGVPRLLGMSVDHVPPRPGCPA